MRLVDEALVRQTRLHAAHHATPPEELTHLTVHPLNNTQVAHQAAGWGPLVGPLEASDWQVQNMLALRAAYLHKLQTLFVERQTLISKVWWGVGVGGAVGEVGLGCWRKW